MHLYNAYFLDFLHKVNIYINKESGCKKRFHPKDIFHCMKEKCMELACCFGCECQAILTFRGKEFFNPLGKQLIHPLGKEF